jgi:hypothetical protein
VIRVGQFFYAVRTSEYDLRQKDLFTDLSSVLNFDDSKNYRGYVQNNVVSVSGRGLSKCRQSITIEQPVGWES